MCCVKSVTVHPSSVTIQTGRWYYDAWAEVCPAYAECADINWYSDNPSVASVNATSGYIYGRNPGTTKIYAEATDGSGINDYITVTVTSKVSVTSVTLNRTSLSLEKGNCCALTATVCPENATNQELCWRSTNTSVAEVSNGVVAAKASGHAYIYAEATDGSGKYARCYVHVTEDILVTSVTVNPLSKILRVGESDFFHATVCPENATDKCVVWVSSNPSVATIISNSGLVLAHRVGQTTIKAAPRDGGAPPGEYVLTVEPPIPVEDVQVCPASLTLNVGDTERLCAVVCPENATNKRVTWRSSNENVACVDYYTGEITANLAGTATITATTVDGSFQACCKITVNYCGGSDYRDVTKHTLVLQDDGYYVCSTCGYRIKSPELEDKEILSLDDYLKIVSTMHFYTQCKLLAEETPLMKAYYNLQAENAQLFIDSLRSQEKYSSEYSYVNSSGTYHCNATNYNTLSLVEIADINLLNIGVYNGVYESICSAVLAYYCPEIAVLSDVLSLVTGQMNALDFGAFIAGMYEDVSENMGKYSKALTVASALLEMTTSEVSLDDRVVRINLDPRTSAHYIFDKDSKIKSVRIFYP